MTELVQRGALLLRGFPLATPEDFSALFASLEPQGGMGYSGGFTVREPVAKAVYTSTAAPPMVLHGRMPHRGERRVFAALARDGEC